MRFHFPRLLRANFRFGRMHTAFWKEKNNSN